MICKTWNWRKKEKAKYFAGNLEVMMGMSSYILGIVMFVICAYFVSLKELNYGQMVAIVQLSNGVMPPLSAFFGCMSLLVSSLGVWNRIADLYKEDEINRCENDQIEDNIFVSGIELSNVSFSYDGISEPLKSVNYYFRKNKKYAIIGPSGCGKSTLLKLILKYYTDYTGKITIDERDYKNICESYLYSHIAYIQQDTLLFNDTFKNNITLGERYSEHEIQEAIRISGLYPLVSHLDDGVNTLIEENGKNFSGGERQRIALCRAILRKADIYLLDEADSGIDKEHVVIDIRRIKEA